MLDRSRSKAVLGGAVLAASVAQIARGRRRSASREPRIADVMSRDPVRIDSAASAQVAARRMAEEGVGVLAVCNRRGRPVGVLTDRDMVVRVLAQARDPERITVGDCLHGEVATVDVRDSLSDAGRRMRAHGVRRLPVVLGDRLVGIITQADLAVRDPSSAVWLERELTRLPSDAPSAAWLLRQPY